MEVTAFPSHQFHFLVCGGEPAQFGFLKRFPITRDPNHPFEAVILLAPVKEQKLFDTLVRQNRLLSPIVNLSGKHLVREDFFHPSPSQLSLESGLNEVWPILKRNAELTNLSEGQDRAELLALALAYTRDTAIEARLTPGRPEMVDYPLLRGLPEPRKILEELAFNELIHPRFFQRLHYCGRCGSSRLLAREECTECHSSQLEEDALVHHYRCGYQGPETGFRDGSELVCPKCHRKLRHYAVDYDKPGTVQLCRNCGHTQSEPLVGFLCGDCGLDQEATAVDTKDWYHYELLPAAVDALGNGLLPYRSLASVLNQSYGAYSIRDFLTASEMAIRVALRYKRPLTGFRLVITNASLLTEKLGGRGLSRLFSRLGEIISQTLRESDLITATNNAIYTLLPETSEERAMTAVARIEEGVRKNISEPLAFDVSTFSKEDAEETLAELR